jgi:hypothetical protein
MRNRNGVIGSADHPVVVSVQLPAGSGGYQSSAILPYASTV